MNPMPDVPTNLPPKPPTLPPRPPSSLRARAGARTQRAARGVREFMRPERLREFGKTLTLVAPLTLLIWIWAEREQTVGSKENPEKQTFQLAVQPTGVGRAVSLAAGQNNTITVGFSGPRVGSDGMKAALLDHPEDRVMKIDVPDTYEPGSEYRVTIDPTLLNKQKIFSDNGLYVFAAEPAFVQVFVDRQVEREVPVTLPPELSEGVASMQCDPSTVKITGPERLIKQLDVSGALKAEIDIASLAELRKNPGKPLEKIPLRPIENAPGVKFSTSTIARATLTLSQEEQGDLPFLVVNVSKPQFLNVVVNVTPETLKNVRVIGPSDVLKQLHDEKIVPKPYAELLILREDIGSKGATRVPTIRELPPGVRVVQTSVSPLTFDVTELKASD